MELMAMTTRSFKEVQLLLITSILATAVTPFAIVRLQEQKWAVGLLDFGIVSVMLGLFAHVYLSRETRLPGIVIAVTFIVASIGSVSLQGVSQIYWAYPALAATFFLMKTRYAVPVCAVSFLSIIGLLWNSLGNTMLVTIALTLLTNILFSYSFALTAKRQRSTLKRLATVDPLTGAGNRRAQNDKIDATNALYRRSHIPASILILDIDFFKNVNDTYGHITGDEILAGVAELVRTNTRPTENLYRYGGEEFTIVAENTRTDGAQQLAEKLRELIDQHVFVSNIHMTASFGLAEVHRSEGPQGWLGRADTALFKAKESGRNRVILAAPAPPPPPKLRPRLVAVET
jgi:diguanylate cyclase